MAPLKSLKNCPQQIIYDPESGYNIMVNTVLTNRPTFLKFVGKKEQKQKWKKYGKLIKDAM